MHINDEPEPQVFRIVLHFKAKPHYFSTYAVALLPKYAIELAREKFHANTALLAAGNAKPHYATVSDGRFERHFRYRSGEWLEFDALKAFQAAKLRQLDSLSCLAAGTELTPVASRGGKFPA